MSNGRGLSDELRYSVVTTVRSQEKADRIAKAQSKYGKDKLDFAIVPDIAEEGAFEEAVKSDPPFEAVVSLRYRFTTCNYILILMVDPHSIPFPFQSHGCQEAATGSCYH